MADARPTERLVHQTVHGYRQGHQLLAASVDLDHDTANILGHNSDSAPRSRASDGSYLTGYPLPEDKYVIARTWSDDGAERPNTVITRSLILPRARPAEYDGSKILSHLKPPTSTERNSETLAPLGLEALCGDSLGLKSDEASEASRFYRTVDRLTHVSAEARGRIAIALWQQLWMPARHNMNFCTAPDTTRFARSERPLLFTNEPNEVSPIATTHRLVVRDLEVPGPFREF